MNNRTMRLGNVHALTLAALALLTGAAGCTKTFVIRPVPPPHLEYPAGAASQPSSLAIADARSGSAKPLNAGTLNVELEGMPDEMAYLGENVAHVLKAEGIPVRYAPDGSADLRLDVHTYRLRNLRTSGFSPYHTFTTFSADLAAGAPPARITAYFKNSKVPVWAFREVERPCYQIPVEVIVKEIAAKLNAHVYGRVVPTETVEKLAASVDVHHADAGSEQYLKVLELGYTNNPAAVAPLVKLTAHEETVMRAAAVSALGMLGARDQLPLLRKLYESDNDYVKSMAVKSIGDLATPESQQFLREVKASPAYHDETIREVVDLYF